MSTDSTDTSPPLNSYLIPDVQRRVEQLSRETCREWGGDWVDGTAAVTELPFDTTHRDRTVVRSVADAHDAFDHYTAFYEHVLSEHDATSDHAVLVPCGATKPIGTSSVHRKKLNALRTAGLFDDVDVIIMSEPCTVIPHDLRLSLPAVNYDFPPEYTEEDRAPGVFETFADRLAQWLEHREYDTVYPYLVERHQNKFDAALERASVSPDVVEVPGASVNLETQNYTGDVFKSVEDIAVKLRHVRVLRGDADESLIADAPTEVTEEYRERL